MTTTQEIIDLFGYMATTINQAMRDSMLLAPDYVEAKLMLDDKGERPELHLRIGDREVQIRADGRYSGSGASVGPGANWEHPQPLKKEAGAI